jgi:hypothetical protein
MEPSASTASTASVCTSGVYILTLKPEREYTRSVQLWDAISRELLWSGSCSQSLQMNYSPAANKVFGTNVGQASRINVWDIALGTTGALGDEVRYSYIRCSNSGSRLLTQVLVSRNEYITSVWNMEDGIKLCSQACPMKYAAYLHNLRV